MREFFHGWRRKAGCVTLVMACVLAGLWVRTMIFADQIVFNIGERTHLIASARSEVVWLSLDRAASGTRWTTFPEEDLAESMGDKSLSQIVNELVAKQREVGMHAAASSVHYLWPVLILTLLSAYLLLWTPRKRKAESDA